MLEWIGAKILAGSDFIGSVAAWADAHPLAAVPLGIFLFRVVDDIVRLTPTKYDNICLDIFVDAVKSAYTGLQAFKFRTTGKAAGQSALFTALDEAVEQKKDEGK